MLPDILEEAMGLRGKSPSEDDAKPTNQSFIPMRPDQIPISSKLRSTPWKDGIVSLGICTIHESLHIPTNISSGRDNQDFYRYFIMQDVERAEKLLPFSFTLESYFGDKVMRVNNHSKEVEKHADRLGLKLEWKFYNIMDYELVVVGIC